MPLAGAGNVECLTASDPRDCSAKVDERGLADAVPRDRYGGVAKAEQGYFWLTVDGTGFFLNPTITTATMKQVAAGSPAATAGIVAGDGILEVEGHAVPGSKADAIAPLMEQGVGQPLALKLRRSNGAVYSVTLVAIARTQLERG